MCGELARGVEGGTSMVVEGERETGIERGRGRERERERERDLTGDVEGGTSKVAERERVRE